MGKKASFFYMSTDAEYYIYGYTKKGKTIADFLCKNGFKVAGWIDRRFKSLRESGINKVYGIDEEDISKSAIFVISCQSIGTQLEIAKELAKRQYKNVIFMAAGAEFENEYSKVVRGVWENLNNLVLPRQTKIPVYEVANDEYIILDEFSETVLLWLPIESVRTKTMEIALHEFEEENKLSKANINRIKGNTDELIVCIKNLSEFFDFIFLHIGDCSDYLMTYSGLSGRSIKEYVKDRQRVIKLWEEEIEKGTGYFVDAAAEVIWNDKGYFNLIDGLHRSFYLYYKGFTKIPVKMSKEDYDKYYNKEVLDKLRLIDEEKKGIALPHPIFHQSLFRRKELTYIFIAILNYIKQQGRVVNSFLDIGSVNAYLAISMKRYGVSKVGAVICKSDETELIKGCAELVYAEGISWIDSKEISEESYELIYLNSSVADEVEQEVFSMTNKILVYDYCEDEKKQKKICEKKTIFSYFSVEGEMRKVTIILL